ncbi:MAG: formimidoylglutamate deiminase [Alphaproteobacteria bacterium]
MRRIWCKTAMLEDGWAQGVAIGIDEAGRIEQIETGADTKGREVIDGAVLPGMGNLHSHAFQRAMAGLAERTGSGDAAGGDFWGWREVMYGFLAKLTPAHVEAIAGWLYLEMLKGGYTGVAEFHYLHNAPGGAAYDEPGEMSARIVAAAQRAGIALTLLPVLYQTSDFGGQPALDAQRRFTKSTDEYLAMLETLHADCAGAPNTRLGVAAHSLRAVPPEALAGIIRAAGALDPSMPIHIHIAETTKEVADAIAWSGAPPVAWLLDHAEVDRRWTLIHATHMSEDEIKRAARTGATAGLCPTTEANLGDGLFALPDFLRQGGRIGIGSDANTAADPFEELRLLDYGQRLIHRQRTPSLPDGNTSIGAALWRRALDGGGPALGTKTGRLAAGYRADLIVIDSERAGLAGRAGDELLDSLIFAPVRNSVRDVMVGGAWVIRDRRHQCEEELAARYRAAISDIMGDGG